MNLPSSSTFSSDLPARRRNAVLATAFWIIVWLVVIDVVINIAFAYPKDPKVLNPSQMQLYFEYGRSTEGKLARMTRTDREATAPITLSGWYDPLIVTPSSRPNTTVVSFYGMSHAMRLAAAVDRTSTQLSARTIGAPGATTNWSYGAFLRDKDRKQGRVAVLGIMAANLPMITTMSAMTWNVSFPMPYTEDRFVVRDGHLAAIHPPYDSFDRYAKTFTDPTAWNNAMTTFAAHDPMYDSFLMKHSVLDQSSLFRLIRRGYGQRLEREMRTAILGPHGFDQKAEQVQVANAIVRDFAANARRDGIVPVVFIVNNFGFSDYLYQVLRETLERDGIPYLSSHTIVSPNDPRGYLPDSHFTDENDDKLAVALEQVIEKAR